MELAHDALVVACRDPYGGAPAALPRPLVIVDLYVVRPHRDPAQAPENVDELIVGNFVVDVSEEDGDAAGDEALGKGRRGEGGDGGGADAVYP